MSAKDDLDRFDAAWREHLAAIAGEKRHFPGGPQPPHKYVGRGDPGTRYEARVDLGSDLSRDFRDRVVERLELAVAALVVDVHREERANLVELARAEAKAVLEELGA